MQIIRVAGGFPLLAGDHAVLRAVLVFPPGIVKGDGVLHQLAGTAGQKQAQAEKKTEKPLHDLSTSVSKAGKVTVKTVPLPTVLETEISPRLRWTMVRTMASPSPLPPLFRERALSTR